MNHARQGQRPLRSAVPAEQVVGCESPHPGGAADATPAKLYAVPRRYDLATLFAISLAYALLFGAMRLVQMKPVGFAIVASFVTFVGLAQALLFHGSSPRLASLVAGITYWIVGALVSWCGILWEASGMSIPYRVGILAVVLLFAALPCAVAGSLLGYLAGVLIGGVFLIADLLRRWMRKIVGT